MTNFAWMGRYLDGSFCEAEEVLAATEEEYTTTEELRNTQSDEYNQKSSRYILSSKYLK